ALLVEVSLPLRSAARRAAAGHREGGDAVAVLVAQADGGLHEDVPVRDGRHDVELRPAQLGRPGRRAGAGRAAGGVEGVQPAVVGGDEDHASAYGRAVDQVAAGEPAPERLADGGAAAGRGEDVEPAGV